MGWLSEVLTGIDPTHRASAVRLVVAANSEQDDLFLRHLQREGDTRVVGYADRLDALEVATKRMIPQVRLKGILLQIAQDRHETLLELRVLLQEFL